MFTCCRLPNESYDVTHCSLTQNKIAVDGKNIFIAPNNKIYVQNVYLNYHYLTLSSLFVHNFSHITFDHLMTFFLFFSVLFQL